MLHTLYNIILPKPSTSFSMTCDSVIVTIERKIKEKLNKKFKVQVSYLWQRVYCNISTQRKIILSHKKISRVEAPFLGIITSIY